MSKAGVATIPKHFAPLSDPRVEGRTAYPLLNIVFMAICAVICGVDTFTGMEVFAESKRGWLSRFLDLSHGIPSHDTFNDVLAHLNPTEFERCLLSWVTSLVPVSGGQLLAIDGKTIRGSYDAAEGKAALHMVSVWATKNHLSLGQQAVAAKSNEITAIPKLLSRLDIAGAVVTLDAMGCQKKVARQIIQQGGDYVLSLKGNQGNLHEDVATYFSSALSPEASVTTYDGEHGRIETRTARMSDDIDWLNERHNWPGLQSIIAVTSKRETADKVTEETRYFVSSRSTHDPDKLAHSIRAHWAIENNLHWVLDVSFDEDRNRTRKGHSAANLAIIRHIALNLIKKEKTSRLRRFTDFQSPSAQ